MATRPNIGQVQASTSRSTGSYRSEPSSISASNATPTSSASHIGRCPTRGSCCCTITALHPHQAAERGLPLTFELSRFIKFILTEIFPGGRLPSVDKVEFHATANHFTVDGAQSLRRHYAKTLDTWATRLCRHRAKAIALQSEEVYLRYMKYFNGCAQLFRDGYTDVHQFTLRKAG